MAEPLDVWLKRRGLWVSAAADSSSIRPVTHVFLDGGKASIVRPEDREAFMAVYAKNVAAGRPMHAVERTVGASYRMFVDIDLPLPPEATPASCCSRQQHRHTLIDVVRAALSSAPPELRVGRVSVCTRSAHDQKTGAHLVWSDVARVDDRTAAALRDVWVDALLLAGDEFASFGSLVAIDWNSVIDASVYRRNGLRMPWSLKRGGSALAAYVPTHVATWDAGGVLSLREDDERDVLARLRCASIDADASDSATSASAALVDACSRAPAGKTQANKKRPAKGRKSDPAAHGEQEDDRVIVVLTADDRAAIAGALPATLYADCEVGLRCRRNSERGGGITVSCTSRYCQAVGREHGSNHVFFDIVPPSPSERRVRIVQRCHKCPDARVPIPIKSNDAAAAVARMLRRHAASSSSSCHDPQQPASKKTTKKRRCPSLLPGNAATAAGYWLARLTGAVAEDEAEEEAVDEADAPVHV